MDASVKRPVGRPKRSQPSEDGNGWDCSVCTFKNKPEAFKCDMCDTRKGTSTRKPKTNQQQVIIHQVSVQQMKKEKSLRKQKFRRPARLKNIDRSTAHHMVVTVGDVTVIITDYKPKPETYSTNISRPDNMSTDSMSYHDSTDTDSS